MAASATVALTSRLTATPQKAGTTRELYELRAYHLKAGTRITADADPSLLDAYLERAMLPALGRLGIRNVGVFTEVDVNRDTATTTPKGGSPVWVLIPHASPDSFVQVTASLTNDPAIQSAGADYLQAPKSKPAFERIDSWLYLLFQGQPRFEPPAFSRERVATRIFEMRDYESHSELKAMGKMAMFDEGEISLMEDLGMNPFGFGQAIAGPNLPHLRYFTSGPDLASHFAGWKKFGPDPRWIAMKDLPQYADTVSKNTARFLAPKAYSQI